MWKKVRIFEVTVVYRLHDGLKDSFRSINNIMNKHEDSTKLGGLKLSFDYALVHHIPVTYCRKKKKKWNVTTSCLCAVCVLLEYRTKNRLKVRKYEIYHTFS